MNCKYCGCVMEQDSKTCLECGKTQEPRQKEQKRTKQKKKRIWQKVLIGVSGTVIVICAAIFCVVLSAPKEQAPPAEEAAVKTQAPKKDAVEQVTYALEGDAEDPVRNMVNALNADDVQKALGAYPLPVAARIRTEDAIYQEWTENLRSQMQFIADVHGSDAQITYEVSNQRFVSDEEDILPYRNDVEALCELYEIPPLVAEEVCVMDVTYTYRGSETDKTASTTEEITVYRIGDGWYAMNEVE